MRNAKITFEFLFLISLPLLITLLFTRCAVDPSNERVVEMVHIPEEISQCKPGDTLVIKDYWKRDVHDQDIGIYHGGPIANDEHLAILGK